MFKADGSITIAGKKMAVKQLTGLFYKDNKVLIFFALQSKVKQLATHMKEGLDLLCSSISDKILVQVLQKK